MGAGVPGLGPRWAERAEAQGSTAASWSTPRTWSATASSGCPRGQGDVEAAARHRGDEPVDPPSGGHRVGHRDRAGRVRRAGGARHRPGRLVARPPRSGSGAGGHVPALRRGRAGLPARRRGAVGSGGHDRPAGVGRPTGHQPAALAAPGVAKVPVDVAASGPKVIAVGAPSPTASPSRWAPIPTASPGHWTLLAPPVGPPGLDPTGISFGAYVNCVVHDDAAVAHRLGEGGLASFARFSVMEGAVRGPATDGERHVLSAVHDAYDMNVHTQAGTPQAAALTPEFADQFGVFGPPSHCVAQVRALPTSVSTGWSSSAPRSAPTAPRRHERRAGSPPRCSPPSTSDRRR